ncbi:MAG: hypothetical protein IIA82_06165 [Thaumarchaeota archaeon]|nr:hypothetical protein [Nitrososphaerota archaeon]
MNKDIIPNIKSSVVAIGLIDSNSNPIVVGGSGFVVHREEYIVTTSHVITDLGKEQKRILDENKIKTFMTIFDYQVKGDGFRMINAPIGKIKFLKLIPTQQVGGLIWILHCSDLKNKKTIIIF